MASLGARAPAGAQTLTLSQRLAAQPTYVQAPPPPGKAQLSVAAAAYLQKAAAALNGSTRYTAAQKQAVFKALVAKVARAPGALVPAVKPNSSSGGQSTLASIEGDIRGIVHNPLVQGGLDVVGAALGDPELGQQVAQGVEVATAVVNVGVEVVGALGGALDSLLGAGISPAQIAQNQAIYRDLVMSTGSAANATAAQQREKTTPGRKTTVEP